MAPAEAKNGAGEAGARCARTLSPVIAAGVIADSRGINAALRTACASDTALTTLFTGRPARGIVNRLMRELGPLNANAPAFPAGGALVPLRATCEEQGVGDSSNLWAGQAFALSAGRRGRVTAFEFKEGLVRGCLEG